MKDGWVEIRVRNNSNSVKDMEKVMVNLLQTEARWIRRGVKTGDWISDNSSTANGMEVGS